MKVIVQPLLYTLATQFYIQLVYKTHFGTYFIEKTLKISFKYSIRAPRFYRVAITKEERYLKTGTLYDTHEKVWRNTHFKYE